MEHLRLKHLVLTFFGLSVGAIIIQSRQAAVAGALDKLALIAFLVLLTWLVVPSRRDYGTEIDEAGESRALLAGKAANRLIKRVKGLF